MDAQFAGQLFNLVVISYYGLLVDLGGSLFPNVFDENIEFYLTPFQGLEQVAAYGHLFLFVQRGNTGG